MLTCLRALCISGVLTVPEGLSAQGTFATLRGTVHDPSGATIADATITLRNAATHVRRETRSDGEGAWTVFDLPPSRYREGAEGPTFFSNHMRREPGASPAARPESI